MKKIEFKENEKHEEHADFFVDGVWKNSCYYPQQVSLVLRKEFGLRAIHLSDLKDHREWYDQYVKNMDEKMLNDYYYTFFADKFYGAEDYRNSISNAAASFITYGKYKKLIAAEYGEQAAFLAALHHEWMSSMEHGHDAERKEIIAILDKKDKF